MLFRSPLLGGGAVLWSGPAERGVWWMLAGDAAPTPAATATPLLKAEIAGDAVRLEPVAGGAATTVRASGDAAKGRWTLRLDLGAEGRWFGFGNGANGALAKRFTRNPESRDQRQLKLRTGNGVTQCGVLWHSSGWTVVLLATDGSAESEDGLAWRINEPCLALAVAPARDLAEHCRRVSELTGAPAVPPRWAFGYIASKWGYRDRAEVLATQERYLKLGMPVAAFAYDYEWYRTKTHAKDFSFDPDLFPDPAANLRADLEQRGIRALPIRKPRIDCEMELWNEAVTRGWNAAEPKALSRLLDFRQPALRAWYIERHLPLLLPGIGGWWTDEGDDRFWLNHFWTLTLNELHARVRPGERPFALNRSHTPGLQRLSTATWTGDIKHDWGAMTASHRTQLNLGLVGQPFASADIGGFFGGTSPEQYPRWIQAGIWYGVMRTHGNGGRPPWAFGEQSVKSATAAIRLRQQLLPYLYSLAHEARATGLPIMRAMPLATGDALGWADCDDQWQCGPWVLVKPVREAGATSATVRLPPGTWIDWFTGERCAGGTTITRKLRPQAEDPLDHPVFVRAGAIIPMDPPRPRWEASVEALPLIALWPDTAPSAFRWVHDDGLTEQYREGKTWSAVLRQEPTPTGVRLSLRCDATGFMAPAAKAVVRVHRVGGEPLTTELPLDRDGAVEVSYSR